MRRTGFKKKKTVPMERTPLAKRGKSPVALLKAKCDKVMQQIYTAKNPKCDICGKPTYCMHHFVEKSRSNRLRYEEENIIPLCQLCHSYTHNKMNRFMLNNLNRSYSYVDMIINKRGGKEWKDKMEIIGRETIKTNIQYYEVKLEELSKLLK